MNKEYLNLLTQIRDTMEDIQTLHNGLGDLLNNPRATLENLEGIRDTLEEIRSLEEDAQ